MLASLFLKAYKNKIFVMIGTISIALSIFMVVNSVTTSITPYILEQLQPQIWWDFTISSNQAFSNEQQQYIIQKKEELWFEISYSKSTYSNVTFNDELVIARIIAIDNNYPLYWWFEVQNTSNQLVKWQDITTNNQIILGWENRWIDSISSGISIIINQQIYMVWWLLLTDSIASLNIFDQGRKIYVSHELFNKLWISDFGSRNEFLYAVKCPSTVDCNKVQQLFTWTIRNKVEIRDTSRSFAIISEIIDQMNTYSNIIIVISFLFMASIIFFLIEWFFIEQRKYLAILKILGMRDRLLLINMIGIFLLIIIISTLIAYGISYTTVSIIKDIVNYDITIQPITIIQGMSIISILIILSLSIPCIKFFGQSPQNALKDQFINLFSSKEKRYLYSIVYVGIVLCLIILQETLRSSIVISASIINLTFIIFWIISRLLRRLQKIVPHTRHTKYFTWRDALRSTTKPGNFSHLIITLMIIWLTWIGILTWISTIFSERLAFQWNQANFFVINLQQQQWQDLVSAINNIEYDRFNIILWRITSINNIPLSQHLKSKSRWRPEWFTREFNMTTNKQLLNDTIVWSQTLNTNEISLGADFARDLWVSIWDNITMNIAWQEFTFRVAWLRVIDQTRSSPFFFMVLPDQQFAEAPQTFFYSFKTNTQQKATIREIIKQKQRSNPLIIDIDNIINLVRQIWSIINNIITFFFVYLTIFAVLNYLVSIQTMQQLKKEKIKLFRILWAPRTFIKQNIIREYSILLWFSWIISIIISSSALITITSYNTIFQLSLSSLASSISVISIFTICGILATFLLTLPSYQKQLYNE